MQTLQIVLLLCLGATVSLGTHRGKRFLIFPRQAPTRHQFIGGIGIPADLPYESLTEGYVLKAEFFLPYNSTVFRENPLWPEYYTNQPGQIGRRKKHQGPSTLRWDIYAYIVNRLESHGLNGKECLLQAICEANSVKFSSRFNIFAQLMHIFLSPSSSVDGESNESLNFHMAEKIGRKGESCDFYACQMSLLDWVSKILKLDL